MILLQMHPLADLRNAFLAGFPYTNQVEINAGY